MLHVRSNPAWCLNFQLHPQAIKLFEMSPRDGQVDKTYVAHIPGYWGGVVVVVVK